MLLTILLYFSLLLLISFLTGRNRSNSHFFLGSRRSLWYVVAIGMVGSSVSGVSLVSVPGMVLVSGFTYLQVAMGFIIGYVVVALVLMPLYYKMNLTSIYGYLEKRFGPQTHRTGVWFFILSKTVTSSVKMYIAALVLQRFVFEAYGVPMWVTVLLCVLIIWLYTFRSGIGTIVWTDALQTLVLLTTIILMLFQVTKSLNLSLSETIQTIKDSPMSQVFEFDRISDRNFFKQFFSGIFIVIVMTGLSQDMVQSSLSCRTLREAQKNMLCYGAAFVPFNLLLLSLGLLFIVFADRHGITLPEKADEIVPLFASKWLGYGVNVCFIIGILSATFNSADSALTAIVTSLYVDIFKKGQTFEAYKTAYWHRTLLYLTVCFVFTLITLAFHHIGNQSILDTLYRLVGYAYGPLLGLFAFGILTRRLINDRLTPYIAIASPLLTYAFEAACLYFFNYHFGYELLLLNGTLTYTALFLSNNGIPAIAKQKTLRHKPPQSRF